MKLIFTIASMHFPNLKNELPKIINARALKSPYHAQWYICISKKDFNYNCIAVSSNPNADIKPSWKKYTPRKI